MMMAGIVAAHETTANATANAMKLLLQHPRAWRELCGDPGLIPNAVEECLRHNGSVAAWRRMATRDTRVGGVDLPAGSKLLIVTSSANHDEAQFAQADLFDSRRDNASDHLTFGYGSHQCMGKNLARMEMQIFLEVFTRRLPHMRLAAQRFSYVPNTSFRGPEHLWVEWDAALNPERMRPALGATEAPVPVPVRLGEPSRRAIQRTVRVERATPVADGVVRLRLVSADGAPLPRWTAGAHIDIECGAPDVSRQYSLCGDPADAQALEIAVLHEPEGRGGSRWVHRQVRAGDRLRIRGPRNHFRLDEGASKAVLVAGGIGITPIAAMARRAREIGMDYELHYSGSRRAGMAFVDDLQALHGERLHVYAGDQGRRNDLATLLAQPIEGAQVYACGPQRMLDALAACCAGWPEDALRVEHFHSTAGTLDPSTQLAFEAELKDSGIVVTVAPGQTLLAALRGANVDVPSDCEEGLCGTCEVRVLAGQVAHHDLVLTRAEREAGTKMMACCSRAAGTRLVLEL
jgi:ferredoxin-NADP reductase